MAIIKAINPNWRRISGNSYLPYHNDVFQRREPTKLELIQACRDSVFACVSLIYKRVSTIPINLYVETRDNEATPKGSRPTYKSFPHRRKAYSISQVTDHELLDLMDHPNCHQNWQQLIGWTQWFLDVTGDSYWWLRRDDLGNIYEILLLPSYMVSPIRTENGIVYVYGSGHDEVKYQPTEIIHFQADPDGFDPYIRSTSPLKSVYERVLVQGLEVGYTQTILKNNCRPDAVLTPDSDTGYLEAERLSHELKQKFGGAHSGGILILESPAKLTPIGWSPADLSQLQIFQAVKQSICDSYHVPLAIFQEQTGNRSAIEGAEYCLSKYCIKPRVDNIVAKLNDKLAPLFGDRLFFEPDPVEIEDKVFELQKRTAYLQYGVFTPNEVRALEGKPPLPGGDRPVMMPGQVPQGQAQPGAKAIKTPEGTELQRVLQDFFVGSSRP